MYLTAYWESLTVASRFQGVARQTHDNISRKRFHSWIGRQGDDTFRGDTKGRFRVSQVKRGNLILFLEQVVERRPRVIGIARCCRGHRFQTCPI